MSVQFVITLQECYCLVSFNYIGVDRLHYHVSTFDIIMVYTFVQSHIQRGEQQVVGLTTSFEHGGLQI